MGHLGKGASGHLIRTTGEPRHLAKCLASCCTRRAGNSSVSVTLSGGNGCAAAANATYVVPRIGGSGSCSFALEYRETVPDYCADACYEGSYSPTPPPYQYVYWHYTGTDISCSLSAIDNTLTIQVKVWYQAWWFLGYAGCVNYTSGAVEMEFQSDTCDSGSVALISISDPFLITFGYKRMGDQPETCTILF